MSMMSHIAELERKHQALDKQIVAELNHPNKNSTKIAQMKRQKLVLKDEILRLKATLPTPTVH
ncbi:MAG: DUF465 domain-containing protein [Proteobacteria bacterium]|nr:DUF465 domain-containing protein [Pseudomonadota bacterium]